MTEKYRRGTVWWIDAHHGGDQYATVEDMQREHRPMQRVDTGWIVIDDDLGVHLSLSWAPKNDNDAYLRRPSGASDFIDIMFIPRAMIERIEYLQPEG